MSASQIPAFRLRSRDGTAEESLALAGIWRRAWIAANRNAAFIEPITHWLRRVQTEFVPPAEVVLAEREGQVLAFMVLMRRNGYVAQLFVEPHLRNQGLGQALLDEAGVRMPNGWKLHVATGNAAAQRFYERYGLVRGAVDRHPTSGRERVAYHWHPSGPPRRRG
ncbi:putative acetyltransferase [Variovorax sp. TBS-050B]|uniref:GNAT family N-acetyltransferase n=1 Tax=Variovorax sp. TBS-050B TaxID=2940551 RepID=UPI00247437CF|nr:GNAT family N-acetyltransferase [Variovorax sp. TBS-050B]MDH6595200.1 putative acetyltransferase [Variovorax sp. TBS-050B]